MKGRGAKYSQPILQTSTSPMASSTSAPSSAYAQDTQMDDAQHDYQNDLALLEHLKETIRRGQHELYKPVPRPDKLLGLYMGAYVPPHPEQLPPLQNQPLLPSIEQVHFSRSPSASSHTTIVISDDSSPPPQSQRKTGNAPEAEKEEGVVEENGVTLHATVRSPAITSSNQTATVPRGEATQLPKAEQPTSPEPLHARAPLFVKASQTNPHVPSLKSESAVAPSVLAPPISSSAQLSQRPEQDHSMTSVDTAPASDSRAPTTPAKRDQAPQAPPTDSPVAPLGRTTSIASTTPSRTAERKRSDSEERARAERVKEYEREAEKRMHFHRERERDPRYRGRNLDRAQDPHVERRHRSAHDERRSETDAPERQSRERGRPPLDERLHDPSQAHVSPDGRYPDHRFPRPFPDPYGSHPALLAFEGAPAAPLSASGSSSSIGWDRAGPPLPPGPERRSTIKEREKEAEVYKRERALSAEARRARRQLQEKISSPSDLRSPVSERQMRSPEATRAALNPSSPQLYRIPDDVRHRAAEPSHTVGPAVYDHRLPVQEQFKYEREASYYPSERAPPPSALAKERTYPEAESPSAPLAHPAEERKPAYWPEERHSPKKEPDQALVTVPSGSASVLQSRSYAPVEHSLRTSLEQRTLPRDEHKASYYPEERPLSKHRPIVDYPGNVPGPPALSTAATEASFGHAPATTTAAVPSSHSVQVHALPAKPSTTTFSAGGSASERPQDSLPSEASRSSEMPSAHTLSLQGRIGGKPSWSSRGPDLTQTQSTASDGGNSLLTRIGPHLDTPAPMRPASTAPQPPVGRDSTAHSATLTRPQFPPSDVYPLPPTRTPSVRPQETVPRFKEEPSDATGTQFNGRQRTLTAASVSSLQVAPPTPATSERMRIPSNVSLPARPISPPRERPSSTSHHPHPRMDDRPVAVSRPPHDPRSYPPALRPPPEERAYRPGYTPLERRLEQLPPDDHRQDRRYLDVSAPPRSFSPATMAVPAHYRPELAAAYRNPAYPPPPPLSSAPPEWAAYEDYDRRRAAAEWEHERARPREAYADWELRDRERLVGGTPAPALLTRLSEPPANAYRDDHEAYVGRVRPRSPGAVYGAPPAKRIREDGYAPPLPANYYPPEYPPRQAQQPLPPAYYQRPHEHEPYPPYEYDPRTQAPQAAPRDPRELYFPDERRYAGQPPPRRN